MSDTNPNQQSASPGADQLSGAETVYTGPAIAATLAPLLGFYTLMISHHISRLSKEWDKTIHSYGYWIPGSTGTGPDGSIGSYTGKETLAIVVWLVSWAIFHVLWQKQDLPIKKWQSIFLGAMGLVTLGFFHPLVDPVIYLLIDIFG
ncbi:MAG: hypothetical protein ABL925_16395 [Methylococcales bacterium]